MLKVGCLQMNETKQWQERCTIESVVQPRLQPKWMKFIAISTFYYARWSFGEKKEGFIEQYDYDEFIQFSEVNFYIYLHVIERFSENYYI